MGPHGYVAELRLVNGVWSAVTPLTPPNFTKTQEIKTEVRQMKRRLTMLLLLAGSAMISADAFAATNIQWTYHGSVCRPTLSSSGCVEYSQYGIHNVCRGASVTVFCPLDLRLGGSGTVTFPNHIAVTGYDRSTSSDVSCDLQNTDANGNLLSSTISGHSTGGGPGTGPTSILNADIPTPISQYTWYLRCSLPATPDSVWFSHITTIGLTVTDS
jgi:hypothetical protein